MSKFRVGDRVFVASREVCAKSVYWNGRMEKWCGKQVTIDGVRMFEPRYLIAEDHGECSGQEHGGWRWDETMLMPNTQKILITTDGKTTLARLYEGKKVVQSAEAKCAPSDTFDFVVGAKLAFERLVGNQDKPKETVKLYCVKSASKHITKGKVYELHGSLDGFGSITFDNGWTNDMFHYRKAHWRDGSQATECLVPLVKRPAKVGEWVYVVDSGSSGYEANKIYKVFQTGCPAKYVWFAPDGKGYVKPGEYLVLDGYAPKTCDKCGEILE
jgi:hypothetical protein